MAKDETCNNALTTVSETTEENALLTSEAHLGLQGAHNTNRHTLQ